MNTASNPSSIFTAPFADLDDGFKALYVPSIGGSSMIVMDDPRIQVLIQHGFKHAATHGFCAVLFPADIKKAKSILATANLPI